MTSTAETLMIPYPTWVDSLPDAEKEAEKVRFRIRVAALYATREGLYAGLAERVGVSLATVGAIASKTQRLSVPSALRFERALGREVCPREEMAPHFYPTTP